MGSNYIVLNADVTLATICGYLRDALQALLKTDHTDREPMIDLVSQDGTIFKLGLPLDRISLKE